jgi:serine protease Do
MQPIPEFPETPELAERPWLGVGFVMTDEGALITEVVPGSPADESGLQNDDVIAEVDGRAVTEARPLDELILRYEPGDRVELTVLRQGRERTVRVRLASWMEGGMPYWEDQFEMPVEPRWEG